MTVLYVPFEIVEILTDQLDDESIQSLLIVSTTFLTHIRKMHNTTEYWKTRLINNVRFDTRVPSSAIIHNFDYMQSFDEDSKEEELEFWKNRYQHYMATLDGNIFISRDSNDLTLGIMVYFPAKDCEYHYNSFPYCDYADMASKAVFVLIEYGFYESFVYILDYIEYSHEYTRAILKHCRREMLTEVLERDLIDIDKEIKYCIDTKMPRMIGQLYEKCRNKMSLLRYAVYNVASVATIKLMINRLKEDDLEDEFADTELILLGLKGNALNMYHDYIRSAVGSTVDEFDEVYEWGSHENMKALLLICGVITENE